MNRWTLRGGARRTALAAAVAAAIAVPVTAQLRDQPDLDSLDRLKEEATGNSQVMETLSYLTDVNGPRLTNSPLMHQAADWAQKQMTTWGLSNVHTEKWGPRTIDVDILDYRGLRVNEPDLVLPHPYMGQRAFVLAPLMDVAPDYRIGDKSIGELLVQIDARGVEPLE